MAGNDKYDFLEAMIQSDQNMRKEQGKKKTEECPRCGQPLVKLKNVPGKGTGFTHEKGKCKAFFETREDIRAAREDAERRNAQKKREEENKKKGKLPQRTPKKEVKEPPVINETEIITITKEELEAKNGEIFKLSFMEEKMKEAAKNNWQKKAEDIDTAAEDSINDGPSPAVDEKKENRIGAADAKKFDVKPEKPEEGESITKDAEAKSHEPEPDESFDSEDKENTESLQGEIKSPRSRISKERMNQLLHKIDRDAAEKKEVKEGEKRAFIIQREVVKEVVKYVEPAADEKAALPATDLNKEREDATATRANKTEASDAVRKIDSEEDPGSSTDVPQHAEAASPAENFTSDSKEEISEKDNDEMTYIKEEKNTEIPAKDEDDEYGKTRILSEEDDDDSNVFLSSLIDIESGEVVHIDRPVFTIGCKESCNFVLEDVKGDHVISRVHAAIYLKNDTAYIKDFSSNGTFLGDKDEEKKRFMRLPKETEVELKDGICVMFVNRRFVFEKGM